MSSTTRWLILAFAVVGFGLSGASSWVHYRLLTDPTYVSPCDINATFNCSQVYMSRFGSFAGVPVALGGVIWFGLVGLLAAFANPNERPSVAAGYLFGLSVVGLSVSLYLAYASFFVLHTGCPLCIGTYVCVIGIFLLSSFTRGESIAQLPGRLTRDLRDIAARPVTLVAAVLYVAGAASVLAFFPDEGTMAERAASAPAPTASVQQSFEDAWFKQPRTDLGIPAEGAKVIVVKFNDYECPSCRVAEELYSPVIKKFAASHPGAVKYVMKDWPWNRECNFNTSSTIPGHEAACNAAVAARIAKDRGKGDEMSAWLFANQGISPQAVRDAVTRIVGAVDFDREYALKLIDVRRDVADGGVLNIEGTPTYFINGVRLPNDRMLPPELFELAVSLELKKAGA